MKRHIITFITIICAGLNSFAQVDDGLERKYTISGGAFLKVDSLSDQQISLWPEIYATYESNMSKRLSGFFRLNVIIPASIDIPLESGFDDGISGHSARGFGINLGARYYLKEAMHGFYAGPFVSYYRYNHIYNFDKILSEDEYSITSIRGSLAIGYQQIWANGFSLHTYIGVLLDHKYIEKFTSVIDTEAVGSVNLIKPDIGISVGYYF